MATTFYLHDPYESRATMVLFSALTGVRRAGGPAAELGGRSAGCAAAATTRPMRSSSAPAGWPARPPAPCGTPAGWASRTSASSRTSRAAGPATWTSWAPSPTCRELIQQVPDRARLHRPADEPLRRRPPGLRHAVAVAGRGAPGGRRAQPGRPVADDDQPRRPAGHRPAREPALRPERRRQAGHGRGAVAAGPGRAVAAAAADRRSW